MGKLFPNQFSLSSSPGLTFHRFAIAHEDNDTIPDFKEQLGEPLASGGGEHLLTLKLFGCFDGA